MSMHIKFNLDAKKQCWVRRRYDTDLTSGHLNIWGIYVSKVDRIHIYALVGKRGGVSMGHDHVRWIVYELTAENSAL